MQLIVQDLLVHYEKEGSGKTILLLHGWADRLETFQPLLTGLTSSYTVLRLDLPGFGQSQAPHAVWDLDNYAAFVADFVGKINAHESPYAIIGHSNGGAVAIRGVALGLLRPARLVLLAASGVRDTHKLKRNVVKAIAKTGKVMTFWLPKQYKKKLQKKLYGTVGSDMLVTPELQETFKRTVRQDIQADASRISVPTLLVYGDQDKATPLGSVGKKLQGLIKNSQLAVVSGADHFVHQAQPTQVIHLIKEFLKA